MNKDIFGVPFEKGQTVVYPYRKGSRTELHSGVIVGDVYLCSRRICTVCRLVVENPEGRLVSLTRLDNVAVVQQ